MESEAASLEKELLQGLREVVAAFNHFQIRYALIGGIAVGFSLLAANRDHLNLNWVREEWKPLAEEDDARSKEFETMIASLKLDESQERGGQQT